MRYQSDLDSDGLIASFEAALTGHDGCVTRLHNTIIRRARSRKYHEVNVYMSGANVLNEHRNKGEAE